MTRERIRRILQFRDYLESIGMTRGNEREWRFDDKLINPNYKIVYEYAGTFKIYTKTEVRKWYGKYELVTNSWINFIGNFEQFKKEVNNAVANYKKAAQKIKELKAKEDFEND